MWLGCSYSMVAQWVAVVLSSFEAQGGRHLRKVCTPMYMFSGCSDFPHHQNIYVSLIIKPLSLTKSSGWDMEMLPITPLQWVKHSRFMCCKVMRTNKDSSFLLLFPTTQLTFLDGYHLTTTHFHILTFKQIRANMLSVKIFQNKNQQYCRNTSTLTDMKLKLWRLTFRGTVWATDITVATVGFSDVAHSFFFFNIYISFVSSLEVKTTESLRPFEFKHQYHRDTVLHGSFTNCLTEALTLCLISLWKDLYADSLFEVVLLFRNPRPQTKKKLMWHVPSYVVFK